MSTLSKEQAANREKTLLAALLLSIWAPLATGVAVVLSRSITQLADFVRRSVELFALLISWWVFRYLERNKALDPRKRARLEKAAGFSVAGALCCSGATMLLLSLSRLFASRPGGNVYPGLAIALLGLMTNAWFWRRYQKLMREQYSSIIDAQRHLYCAKTFMDLCVIIALGAVAASPGHPATRYVDAAGSAVLSVYLLWSGIRAAQTAISGAVSGERHD
ncbi:MAG: cation transporter [Bacillota bacterium]